MNSTARTICQAALMKQQKVIDVFIDDVSRYFDHLEGGPSELKIGAPYLERAEDKLGCDYTGMASVCGSSQGFVFFCIEHNVKALIARFWRTSA